MWSKIAPKSAKQLRKSAKGCPTGGQNRSKGVPPRGFEKQVANKRATPGINQAFGSKMGAHI